MTHTRKINDSVYEVHPCSQSTEKCEYELLLFHGLCLSDYTDAYKTTWELESDSGWCSINSFYGTHNECSYTGRVLSISYDSCAQSTETTGRVDLNRIGRTLVQDIIHLARVGEQGCPVILVGFCLGGLVIKQLCTEAERQFDQAQDGSTKGRLDQFLTNVRGIAHLDTPHAGSSLGAYLKDYLKYHRKRVGPVLQYFSNPSQPLMELDGDFYSMVLEREWKQRVVRAYHETQDWDGLRLPKGIQVVTDDSARLVGADQTSISANHCDVHKKPDTKKYINDFVAEILQIWKQTNVPTQLERSGTSKEDEVVKRTRDVERTQLERRGTFEEDEVVKGTRKKRQLERCGTSEDDEVVKGTRKKPSRNPLDQLYRPAGKDETLEIFFFPGACNGSSNAYRPGSEVHWLQALLPEDFPMARIYRCNYDYLYDEGDKDNEDFYLPAETLLQEIVKVDSPRRIRRPIVLVGHCFGGLVIKALINFAERKAALHADPREPDLALASEDFLMDIRGIAYVATPHAGCQRHTTFVLNPVYVARLNVEHNCLKAKLGWKELALIETRPTQEAQYPHMYVERRKTRVIDLIIDYCLALFKTRPTQQDLLVSEASASHGIHRHSVLSVAADHFTICNPESRESNSFQYLVHFIRTSLSEAQYPNMNVRRKQTRGIALIITVEEEPKKESGHDSHEEVQDSKKPDVKVQERKGSENDRYRFEVLACSLKFRFLTVYRKKAKDIPGVIEDILDNEVRKEDESFLCIVSAHGVVSDGTQFIFDHEGTKIPMVKDILKPIAVCPKLAGKPKVFVINACRELGNLRGYPKDEENVIKNFDDCLLMYSTKLGTESYRLETSAKKGTLCLREIVESLNLLHTTKDVQDIFERVRDRVPILAKYICGSNSKFEQYPELQSTLRKRLSWRPR